MKKFIKLCNKIRYLGLLGLPGLFVKYPLFDYLWLFWLFGFVDIFYNWSLFKQSLRQFWGMLIIPLRYGSHIPNIDNYRCKVKYSLPFHGVWTVVNGGTDNKSSHSWSIPTQRYAYDFLVLNEEGKSFTGDPTKAESYHCYGKEILAPADGEVVEVGSGWRDSLISGNGQIDCTARDIRGNYILIRHADKEFSALAHLQPDSILVKAGDIVKRGQIIARCGNTGNSSEPHLHFQLQNGTDFFSSAGLPIEFENISASSATSYSAFDPRPVPTFVDLSEQYIYRSQNVANRIVCLEQPAANN